MRRLGWTGPGWGLGACLLVACTDPAPPGLAPPGLAESQAALRPDNPRSNALFRFDDGDLVEHFDSPGGRFRIHFTRAGTHRVAAADTDADGVPNAVQTVAAGYDEVLVFFTETLGFRAPLSDETLAPHHGGNERFDVYLVDFAGRGDGAYIQEVCPTPSHCAGYMAQENDFAGYGYPSLAAAVRILASHELFHAVQAAYDADQGSVINEGTAVWATERFDPTLTDLEGFSDGYLDNPDRPLDEPLPGPVDPFSYGMGLFFQFLDERYGESLILALWESVEDGAGGVADPTWLPTLAGLLETLYETDFPSMLAEFAAWNLYTGRRANSELAWARGTGYPLVASTEVTLPFQDDRLRRFRASTAYYRAPLEGRTAIAAALVGPPEELADLQVFIALRRGNVITWPIHAAVGPVATQDNEEAIVLVVNSALEGQSRRPGLCIGEPRQELPDCVAALSPELPPDAGLPDVGVDGMVDAAVEEDAAPEVDAGPDGGPDAAAEASGGSDGCQHAPGGGSWWGLLGLAAFVRRRRPATLVVSRA